VVLLARYEETSKSYEGKYNDENADQTQGRTQEGVNHTDEQENGDDFLCLFACCGQRLAVVHQSEEGTQPNGHTLGQLLLSMILIQINREEDTDECVRGFHETQEHE